MTPPDCDKQQNIWRNPVEMSNITIGRFDQDPEAQGVIKPADGRWQLVLDKDGYPHLYIECHFKDDDGKRVTGLFPIEEMLPEGVSIRDMMDGEGEFGDKLPPEQEQEAYEAWLARKKETGLPCPKF